MLYLFEESDVATVANVYCRAHRRFCDMRQIFVAERGYTDLGSQHTTFGSYIVYIEYAKVPFAMRQDGKREKEGRTGKGMWPLGTSFHLLGETY